MKIISDQLYFIDVLALFPDDLLYFLYCIVSVKHDPKFGHNLDVAQVVFEFDFVIAESNFVLVRVHRLIIISNRYLKETSWVMVCMEGLP